MKTTKIIIAVMCAIMLSACNSLPNQATDQGSVVKTTTKDGVTETIKNQSDYASYLERASESKPMFEMTCPPTGCVIMSLKVNAPVDPSKIAGPPSPPESLVAVVVKETFGTLRGAIPYYAGMRVLTTAFDKANSSVTTNITRDSGNTTLTASGAGAAVASGGTASGSAPVTTTTTTTTTSNSNNRNCTGGPAGNGAGTTTGGAGGASGPTSC